MNKYFVVILVSICTLIGCANPAYLSKDLGGGYRLTANALKDQGIVDDREIFAIYGHVVDYCFDSVYILAIERPRDSVPECKGLSWKEQNIVFQESTFKQYWVINKLDKMIWGPFKYEEYLKKRMEIGVPAYLNLSTNDIEIDF